MKAIVVGLGQFGSAVAIALGRAGVETIAIDSRMGPVEALKDEVDLAVCTDATSYDSLQAQGVADADVFVAGIGSDFEAQILAVVHAKRAGIKLVVARSSSDTHREVLEAVGVDLVVNPERDAAQDTVLHLLMPSMGNHIKLTEGLSAVEIPAPEGMSGRTLHDQCQDLLQRDNVNLVAVRRANEGGTKQSLLAPGTRIEVGDTLVLVGNDTDLARVRGDA